MTSYNRHNEKDNVSDITVESTARTSNNVAADDEVIKSNSGNYIIFPKRGERAICVERVDNESVPWNHQQVVEEVHEVPGCTFAGKVGKGRLRIDLSRFGVREDAHVEIVDELREEL